MYIQYGAGKGNIVLYIIHMYIKYRAGKGNIVLYVIPMYIQYGQGKEILTCDARTVKSGSTGRGQTQLLIN